MSSSLEGRPGDGAITISQALPMSCWIALGGDALVTALAPDAVAHEASGDAPWGWRIAGIGGERRSVASVWATKTGAPEVTTLRELARLPVSAHILLGHVNPGEADVDALLEGDALIIATGPLPSTAVEAHRLGDRATRVRTLPSFRWSRVYRTAQPILQEFLSVGPLCGLTVRMRHAKDESRLGTVDSMLIDACDVVLDIVPSIESVSAFDRPPNAAVDVHLLSAIARTPEGAVITIDVAEAGGWERSIELLGPAGRLVIADGGIVRWHRDGSIAERVDVNSPSEYMAACLESFQTLVRARGAREEPQRSVARLAFADAARLSARTGNEESPARVEELAARP